VVESIVAHSLRAGLVVAALAPLSPAGPLTGTDQSSRLYTASDPSARGGIEGIVARIGEPLMAVMAMPEFEDVRVFRGDVDSDGRHFRFRGLPVGKYDLILVFEHGVAEGVRLTRGPDTLTESDRQSIAAGIHKANAFFDAKRIHRCEGSAGREGRAACFLQEARTRPVTLQSAEVRDDIEIRSFKLAWLEDVGEVGWQLLKTREVLRQEIGGNQMKGLMPHRHMPELGGIRVVDEVKNLGNLNIRGF
jgi:hypothetical protein